MLKIILCGAAGKMGWEIIQAAQKDRTLKIIAGIEAKAHPEIGKKINGVPIQSDLLPVIRETSCIIDFTNHTATIENLKKSAPYKKPFVIGTTGFDEKELKIIKKFARHFPILLSPNMSLGVNHLYKLVRASTEMLKDYDIEIIETHHRAKKDAPSGTARAIGEIIKKVKANVHFIYGRAGMSGERKKDEICINAIRGGDVVGEHRVLFFGNGEFIELRHYATSRQCFAYGTLLAAKFIVKKKQGFYTMADLLNKPN